MSTISIPKCNRCRKMLKAQSSIIRGIGPVCARRIIKGLAAGLRGNARKEFLNALFAEDVNSAILGAYDNVILALQADGCTLDVDHRVPLSDLLVNGSRLKIIEYVLVIFSDICNQLSQAIGVADSVKQFFITLGLGEDEANKAHKRLIKLAQKCSTM